MTGASPVLAVPLAGVRALEASAGTGKTFAITKLYLRALLEEGLRVEQILVVTYTIAATQELRSRIRHELGLVQRLLDGTDPTAVPEETAHIVRTAIATGAEGRRRAAAGIRLALATFDQAAIHTIHGFCQRVLGEQAFESRQPFVAELDPDPRPWFQGVVDDAWRRAVQGGPGWVAHLLDREHGPDALAALLAPYALRRDLVVRGPSGGVDTAAAESEVAEAWAACRAFGDDELDGVSELLESGLLDGRKLKPAAIRTALATVRESRTLSWPDPPVADAIETLRASRVVAARRTTAAPLRHPVLEACERLAQALGPCMALFERRRAAFRRWILETAPVELDRRKRERGVLTFDDLLLRLDDALAGPDGEALAAAVRARWRVALVDEFQDTDPVQYRIVRRIWGGPGTALLLVGDPKQAIYGFRGADVYTYLRAQEEVEDRRGLAVNHRSDPGLVTAVNTLFGRLPDPFLVPGIAFTPVAPADPRRPPALLLRGRAPAPLRLWFVERADDSRPAAKGETRLRIAAAVASEVALLLAAAEAGEATVLERDGTRRALDGGDIAVLVGSHYEAELVRRALLAEGVSSVLHSRESVLATSEAEALRLVLAAVAEPGREGLVRAALATELLGVRGEELDALGRDERRWEELVRRFRDHHDAFREHGVAYMLRRLFAEWNVAAQLLPYADGERRLTNVLHLAELLAAEAARRPVGLDGLIGWMTARAAEDPPDGDERQLRLESDEHLVKIVTVHKSKGLEYPLVFLPFAWDGSPRAPARDHAAYHDPTARWQLTLDLGPEIDEAVVERVRREELAERMRLLYVALTRARNACVVVWGAIKGAGTSALGWLLHPPPPATEVAQADGRFDRVPDGDLRANLDTLAGTSAGTIAVESLPPPQRVRLARSTDAADELVARSLPGPVPEGWRVASFTSLSAGTGTVDEADRDSVFRAGPRATGPPADDPLLLPAGVQVGTALHEVFERADFAAASFDRLEALAAERLVANGEDRGWARALATAVARTLDTPLDMGGRLRLRLLDRSARLHEVEFTYPVARFDAAGLRARCLAHGFGSPVIREAVERFEARALHGYMRGFIDLVFEREGRWWLVDWKSNWLGADASDYAREKLDAVIAREGYWLQYLVYTVAVHRLLALRVPGYDYERHFGGVFYLFVRGIDPREGPHRGIYADRLPPDLVADLDAWLR